MLTYNRPEYIERSIESLFKKSGSPFDLFVYDDYSDPDVITLLKKLQKKYSFNLFLNKKHKNIALHFLDSLRNLPTNYDIYLKFDSDIEILTNDFLSHVLDVFDGDKLNLSGLSPRVEGVFAFERYPNNLDFYNGHYIRLATSVAYGCSLFFRKKILINFLAKYDRIGSIDDFGIDTKLYEECIQNGNFAIIEDISVYHIDNTLGQRRKYSDYFTDRKRWPIMDNEEIWFLNASKKNYPLFLKRPILEDIARISEDYPIFLTNIEVYLRNKTEFEEKRVEYLKTHNKEDIKEIKKKETQQMYKISSPNNFPSSKNIKHGSIAYYQELPHWAKNDPRVVIEIEEVEIN